MPTRALNVSRHRTHLLSNSSAAAQRLITRPTNPCTAARVSHNQPLCANGLFSRCKAASFQEACNKRVTGYISLSSQPSLLASHFLQPGSLYLHLQPAPAPPTPRSSLHSRKDGLTPRRSSARPDPMCKSRIPPETLLNQADNAHREKWTPRGPRKSSQSDSP